MSDARDDRPILRQERILEYLRTVYSKRIDLSIIAFLISCFVRRQKLMMYVLYVPYVRNRMQI